MIPQLLSKTEDQYSPAWVAEAAHKVMGGIDLDPASCREANRIIRAQRFFTKKRSGLDREWFGRVWLNPPGRVWLLKEAEIEEKKIKKADAEAIRAEFKRLADKWGTRSSAFAWWKKLMLEVKLKRTTEAFFLGFTLEVLRSTQECEDGCAMDFPFCVPRDRMEFSGGSQPTHGNVIVYIGPNKNSFVKELGAFGRCR